jgi:hypothetical protein
MQGKQAATMLVSSKSGKNREQAAEEATAIHHLLQIPYSRTSLSILRLPTHFCGAFHTASLFPLCFHVIAARQQCATSRGNPRHRPGIRRLHAAPQQGTMASR